MLPEIVERFFAEMFEFLDNQSFSFLISFPL